MDQPFTGIKLSQILGEEPPWSKPGEDTTTPLPPPLAYAKNATFFDVLPYCSKTTVRIFLFYPPVNRI